MEATETTGTIMEITTKFNSKTYTTYFIIILEDIYQLDLSRLGRVPIVNNTSANLNHRGC